MYDSATLIVQSYDKMSINQRFFKLFLRVLTKFPAMLNNIVLENELQTVDNQLDNGGFGLFVTFFGSSGAISA